MDIQEKLDFLKRDIMSSVQKEKTEIFIKDIYTLKKDLENNFQKYIYNAIQKIKIKKNQLEYQNIKSIADFKLNLKKNLLEFREKIKKEIFHELENKIKIFIQSEDYFKYIYMQIKNINLKNKLDSFFIEFSCFDQKLIDYISNDNKNNKLNYKFVLGKENFLGGYRIYLLNKKILIDKSFKAYLDNIKDNINLFKLPVL